MNAMTDRPFVPEFGRSLFIFTRDIRVHDNSALLEACERSEVVIPCFVFSPTFKQGVRLPEHRIQFLRECLADLAEEFAKRNTVLHVFCDDYSSVLKNIYREQKIDAVFMNQDYTPFAKKRQAAIAGFCKNTSIPFCQYADHFLYHPDMIKTKKMSPYTVFSQFFRAAMQIPVSESRQNGYANFECQRFDQEVGGEFLKPESEQNLAVHGGRKNALKILKRIADFAEYDKERDYPEMSGTTMLSAHSRFGTISSREVYHAISGSLGMHHALMRQIHWREFFFHILYHFPHVTSGPFRGKYSRIRWSCDKNHLEAWKNGRTGFPIVDAGMRQMNKTGFMHNRVRMIAASFLVKDLRIDWKVGERYFAEKLADYDPAVNNGNWQWAASTGCDAQPWFRIFNPWLQQRKFDVHCRYILRWVPELAGLKPEQIHNLHKVRPADIDYPPPIVDHSKESSITKRIFQSL